MKKGHYLGGGSLDGFGTVSKPKGRRGGLGSSGAAVHYERQEAAKKKKLETAKTIRSNEKVVKMLGKEWAAEKGRILYGKLVKARQIKSSPLAAALDLAFSKKGVEDKS